jgi:radical SAM protein with 4Fe4S-binding SPASM domain
MCVEPNGDVIPCQSYYKSLGNLLTDSWPGIWEHPLALSLRERRDIPAKCHDCSLLVECGGGCPLHRLDETPTKALQSAS